MRKTEQPPEPSIEEILASIRKIISDDGETSAEPAFDPYDTEHVRKQAERAQAGDPGADARGSETLTDNAPFMEDELSDLADSSVNTVNSRLNDEIFELTDDCLLEELEASRAAAASRRDASRPGGAVDTTAAIEKSVASLASNTLAIDDDEQAPIGNTKLDIPPLPTEEELAEFNSVLSNVVAEMHRITDVKGFEPPADFMPGMHEPRSASAASQAMRPPASAKPSAPSESSASLRKPAWSARNRSAIGKPKVVSASGTEPKTGADAKAKSSSEASATAKAASGKPSPLMEAIATSLVTALADTNERQEKSAAKADAINAKAAMSASDTAIADAQEPLPEDVIAPDMDEAALESSAAKQASLDDACDISSGVAPMEEASETSQAAFIETPDLPSEDASSAIGSSSSIAMPSTTPQEDDAQPATPTALTMVASLGSAAPEATSALMDSSQASLPAGLEEGVEEMLKPLLTAWLDENLPRLVEKALSRELDKRDPLKKP